MRRVPPVVPLLILCVSTLLGPAPDALCEGGTITAEFPEGRDGAASVPTQVEPPGRYIMITHLNDNRISWDPSDGIISVYEARVYAKNPAENVVTFWPGFGRITINYSYFDLHGPEDIFNGRHAVKFYGRWAKGGDLRKTFSGGFMEIDGDGSEVRDCFFGLDFDRQTPLHTGGQVFVRADNCRVHDNVFGGKPDVGRISSVSILTFRSVSLKKMFRASRTLDLPASFLPTKTARSPNSTQVRSR